jgi:glycosyltransferase involved in cell wall biosynthesis
VYNVEPWLSECLTSAVEQTLEDIQIICVNDGSIDGSLEILNRFAATDPRLIIHSQENKGLSEARNAGLDLATGTYIQFLDADDVLEPHAMAECYAIAEADELDLLAFERNIFQDGSALPKVLPQTPNMRIDQAIIDAGVMNGDSYFARIAPSDFSYLPVYLYFIRKSHLEHIGLRFLPGVLHEDIHFTCFMLLQAQRVRAIDQALYFIRKREGSITVAKPTVAHLLGRFYAAADLHELMFSEDYPDEVAQQVFLFTRGRIHYSWRTAKTLSDTERDRVYETDNRHRRLYWLEAKSWLDVLDEKNAEIARLQKQNSRIKKSRAFRIGRAITWLPRKVRALLARMTKKGAAV